MKNFLFNLLAVLGLGSTGTNAHAIEEPAYTVVRQYQAFEVRQYAPYLVAEVNVPGPASEAGNQGFKILAAYIFGKNKGDRKIAMTAPVTQTPEPRKIAMTAPVTQAASDTGFIIQFTMPREFTLDTLPEPLDSSVKLKEIPGGRFAVIRYSGRWSEANYADHLAQLQQAVKAEGVSTRGEPIYSRYNAPFVPWFMRRNEIWLHVD
ncbi:MAG: heme-binding protein [Rhodocyclaceae bacterium]|nr:heme-binding protein [Rhodocyclaceae bacterium]MDZ4213620.1 heme-binding protein [Rhodocyclaceae bacterium]